MKEDSTVKELMLSTSDNPFNPFTQPEEWYAFDLSKGYNTLGYLAAVTEVIEDGFERENLLARNEAIYDAARFNFTGNRIVVEKS